LKVAAYQSPLLRGQSIDAAVELVREQVAQCEAQGVAILCCPEGILGGLADYVDRPADIAIEAAELDAVLAPIASDRVSTILGFTEIDARGRLFNAAAVFHKGSVIGVQRKLHPAINRSVYDAGDTAEVFTVDGLTFGILICCDSNFPEVARTMVLRGAAALFVPTNNGLPLDRNHTGVAADARRVDVSRASESGVPVIRADVAGRNSELACAGSSAIVDRHGVVLCAAPPSSPALIVAELATGLSSRAERRGDTIAASRSL